MVRGPNRKEERILITFTGRRDPYYEKDKKGPILSLLDIHKDEGLNFTGVELFYTEEDTRIEDNAKNTMKAIKDEFGLTCNIHKLPVKDPTDYKQILEALRGKLEELGVTKKQGDKSFFINIAPGTPQMHASWLVLTALGDIWAKVFYTPNPNEIKPGSPRIRFIDPFDLGSPFIGRAAMPRDIRNIPEVEIEEVWNKIGIVSNSDKVRKVYREAAKASQGDGPVIILGETGSGKDLLARFIHSLSPRKEKKYIPINCSAVPPNLIESELFGYVKGAFTDAKTDKKGLFHEADGGTLFLDEIGTMPLDMQAKLLRAIESKKIRPVGSVSEIPVDVRIIAATNEDIKEKARKGEFREDLYYRLCGTILELPPLRERPEDIRLIAEYYLRKLTGGKQKLSEGAIECLMKYSWPGNCRELIRVMENTSVIAETDEIDEKTIREVIRRISIKPDELDC